MFRLDRAGLSAVIGHRGKRAEEYLCLASLITQSWNPLVECLKSIGTLREVIR